MPFSCGLLCRPVQTTIGSLSKERAPRLGVNARGPATDFALPEQRKVTTAKSETTRKLLLESIPTNSR
eukprot:6200385-Pleurochrysis_carterae.AAC.1